MACLRSLSNRTNLLRQRRQPPAFAYVLHDNDPKREQNPLENHGIAPRIPDYTPSHFSGYASPLQRSSFYRFSFPVCTGAGASFARYMSTAGGGGGASEGVDVASVLKDGAEVLTEAVTAQAPVVSEVAAAAADCSPPVAALQYLIDWVHCFTGFNWWASIVVTTLLIRVTTVPLLINQLKATHKLSLLRPQLEEIGEKVKDQSMDVAEGQQKLKKLYAEYNVSPLTPLKGLLIQGPLFISFFFAISNMVEKVPSLKSGGAFWFVDLTTPDSLYIFPVLTALTFWITVECNVQEGMEGNAYAGTMKNISRIFAAASIPLTMGFQKAIFCYWITSNLFSLTYGLVLKAPGVKKFLGVPEVPVARPPTTPQPSFSLSSALKQYKELSEKRAASASPSVEPVKLSDRKISSSSVLSERIKRLEKQVKGKKKNKKK